MSLTRSAPMPRRLASPMGERCGRSTGAAPVRDPTAGKTKQARVTAAITEARGLLFPLRIVSWSNPNNDPRIEFEAAVSFMDALLGELAQAGTQTQVQILATGETKVLSQ